MSKLPRHLLNLSKLELEGMCVDCGLCCYASVPFEKGNVMVPDLRCKNLSFDKAGESKCKVYSNRHDVAPWCLPLEGAIDKGVFPDACPYVKGMENYCGSAVLSESAFNIIEPQLRKSILKHGKPEWVSDANWARYNAHE